MLQYVTLIVFLGSLMEPTTIKLVSKQQGKEEVEMVNVPEIKNQALFQILSYVIEFMKQLDKAEQIDKWNVMIRIGDQKIEASTDYFPGMFMRVQLQKMLKKQICQETQICQIQQQDQQIQDDSIIDQDGQSSSEAEPGC